MADLQQTETASPTPASSGDVTAATSNPTPTTVTESSSSPTTPAAVSTEAAAPSAGAEAVKTEASTESAAENVLGDTKAEPAKTETAKEPVKEVAKTDGDKAADKAPADAETKDAPVKTEAVALPVYEIKLPENVSLDKEAMGEFTKLIGEIETGKLDHDAFQLKAQTLADMHIKGVNDSIQRLNDYYTQYHENQKKEWFDAFKKDPDLGGENLVDTVSNLRSAVESYAGNETQIAEFRQVMKETGVGNHPAVIRLLNNMDAKIRKYETESDNGNNGNNRIVPGARPAPTKVKPHQVFYTGT